MLIKEELFSPYVIRATATGFALQSLGKNGKDYETIKDADDLNPLIVYMAHLKAINAQDEMQVGEYQFYISKFVDDTRQLVNKYVEAKVKNGLPITEENNGGNESEPEVIDNIQQA